MSLWITRCQSSVYRVQYGSQHVVLLFFGFPMSFFGDKMATRSSDDIEDILRSRSFNNGTICCHFRAFKLIFFSQKLEC